MIVQTTLHSMVQRPINTCANIFSNATQRKIETLARHTYGISYCRLLLFAIAKYPFHV